MEGEVMLLNQTHSLNEYIADQTQSPAKFSHLSHLICSHLEGRIKDPKDLEAEY